MMPFLSISRRARGLILPLVLLISFTSSVAQKHPPTRRIDLNVANAKELQQLPGVGAVTAQRIIEMRQKSGRFRRVEDLLAISGITRKKLQALRPYVAISPPAQSTAKKPTPASQTNKK
jgi:competence ComEA-like helix-hairpin-helix protein